MRKRTKNGDTARRIYKLLHRNPDLTTLEVAAQLPYLTQAAVQTMISRMHKRGEIESRGKKMQLGPNGRWRSYSTYHVKYKARSAPEVEVPKAAWSAADIRPEPEGSVIPVAECKVMPVISEPEGPVTPVAEREVLVLRHLTDIYKAMALMTEQQDTLIEVLKGTLMDLAETKDELERERQRRNWWDKVKGLFA